MTSARLLTGEVLGVPVQIEATSDNYATISNLFVDLFATPTSAEPAVRLVPNMTAGPIDLAALLAELTWATVAASPLLCMHAAVVAGADGLVVIPGRSGLGKTTLAACLVQAGFGYVSDECLAVHRETGQITAFPRPLALDGDVWSMFSQVADATPPPGTEAFISPHVLGKVGPAHGTVRDIVLAVRDPSYPISKVSLEATTRGPAVELLLTRAFNHFRDPAASFAAVVALVRQARVWRATYSHAPVFAALMSRRFGIHDRSWSAQEHDQATDRLRSGQG